MAYKVRLIPGTNDNGGTAYATHDFDPTTTPQRLAEALAVLILTAEAQHPGKHDTTDRVVGDIGHFWYGIEGIYITVYHCSSEELEWFKRQQEHTP
jgi:hypothetical protein